MEQNINVIKKLYTSYATYRILYPKHFSVSHMTFMHIQVAKTTALHKLFHLTPQRKNNNKLHQ